MKFYARFSLLVLLFFSFIAVPAFAQTIAVTNNFDATIPYSRGSSIAVPVYIDNTAGNCVTTTNTYQLYLSDALGNFAPAATPIATVSNSFYITYINAAIPAATPAGTGYKVKVVATSNPSATIIPSASFTITTGAAINPGIDGQAAGGGAFGVCNTTGNFTFNYLHTTGPNSGTVAFFNELSQTTEATNNSLSGTFNVSQSNYTIFVKATDGTNYGSKAYTLINNTASNSITSTGSNSACLPNGGGGGATLTYKITLSDLVNNFPGDVYSVTWGDNNSNSYTYCDLVKSGGIISHTYTTASCGNITNVGNNIYEINVQPVNPYCGAVGTRVTSYAKITLPAYNKFTGPLQNGQLVACTNTPATFINQSYPGQDPTNGNCNNARARYTWLVDGVPAKINATLADQFTTTFTTAGVHHVRLELQAGTSECGAVYLEQDICVQDSPTPSFTVPAAVCATSPVTPVNTFVLDNSCFANTIKWTVTGGTVSYAGGTSSASLNPQFVFSTPGIYKIDLAITDACGAVKTAPQQQIVVNTTPAASLSPNAFYCGPQILNFSTAAGKTQTTFSGTTVAQPTTYTWTVTGGAYTFTNGTTLNSQYPQISFTNYGTYTVSVTHQNNCGTVTKSQQITIQDAPSPNAGPPATICVAPTYQLTGTVTGNTASVTSTTWTKVSGGDGSLTNANTLTPTYNLGPNDILHGGAIQFKLTVNTSLGAPCDVVSSLVTITITPPDVRTSAATGTSCSGVAQNYTITSTNSPTATYTWTATLSSGSATGFTANGSGNKITDAIVNTDANTDAVIKYTITPTTNTCVSAPFDYVVTVPPTPVLTAIADATICSGSATNIALSATPAGTKFTWTVSAPAGTGATAQNTAVAGPIVQTLANNTTLPVTVTYNITPIGTGGCTGTPVAAKVIIQPNPTVADANISDPSPAPVDAICSQGATSTYTFKGNVPTVGTGTWALLTGQSGIVITNPHQSNSTVTGLIVGEVYKFRWFINYDPACTTTSQDITVTVDPPSVGGTALFTNGTDKLTICKGSGGTINLTGQVGNVIRWEQSVNGGSTWTTIAGANTNTTYVFNNLSQSTSYRAVVLNGNCTTANSSQVDVTVTVPPVPADAGVDQTLCNAPTTTLHGNTPPAGTTGKWTLKTAQTAVTFDNDTSPNAVASGLAGGQTYVFTWTLDNASACGPNTDDVTITDQPTLVNTITTSNATVCPGSNVLLSNASASGGVSPYSYSWEQSVDNGATWTIIIGETGPDANVKVNQTSLFRRTVYSAGKLCSVLSNEVTVTTQPPVTNNTIAGTTPSVCGNVTPGSITGSTPTGGDGTGVFFYQWQQSIDNGVTFKDINGATGKDYQPPILATGKVIFRRLVSTALCSGTFGNTSNTYAITTNANVTAKFTATNQIGCAPFNITSANIATTADPNASTYSWFANGTPIGTGLSFPGYNIPTEGSTVTIKLVVSSALGCADASYSLDFTTPKVSFTVSPNSGCADAATNKLTIKFTNTSTPTNATYVWSFGDGSADYIGFTPPDHVFAPDPFGNDKAYKITLTAQGCTASAINTTITVYPNKPLAALDVPATGCSPYAIRVKNLSLGTNSSYKFTLRDENDNLVQTIIKTDKSDAVFNPVNADVDIKVYHVALEATNLCGTPSSTGAFPVIIAPTGIHPALTITPLNSAGQPAGCAPFLANFHNLSTGGTSYVYNVYDSNFAPLKSIPATGDINYNFDTPGTYYVSVGVFSNCAAFSESAKIKVVVYPVPAPAFTSDANNTSCSSQTVTFTNTTAGTPASPAAAMIYTWDFGDGTKSNDFSPTHTYDYKNSPYTVTLTAVNSNGCTNTVVKTGYVIVHPPPETEFTATPGLVVSIPVYTLHFIDKTKNAPVGWTWNFGDGVTSSQQNPSHTYADTGKYSVKLVTRTAFGCMDSVTRLVQVTGVPGQLYVPNAFMPTSLTPELRVFMVKGSGLESYTLRIFNNWGQMIFETSKLNSKGEPVEFWDGKFKGVDSPQGVYAWQISAHFINGTDWVGMSYHGSAPRKAGTLTLIR
ncbi:PKD domain-containing protein [Mucilaginibacter boryungensis]|uniref:PKD domain-containing protein n=1 Tax=Mucilaginibacter boryungensis TaxID=768480 RepID=A0ABR9XI12_9SPHI|nr:PKD domain-containing protein [Mucilaginibacter boryungensis]MBE9667028.1 PKD domain-containing protein [Mucilaginibacter boryungensis]